MFEEILLEILQIHFMHHVVDGDLQRGRIPSVSLQQFNVLFHFNVGTAQIYTG